MAASYITKQWNNLSVWACKSTGLLDDTPLPLKEAITIFDEFDSRPELVFDIFQTGCAQRAQIMCENIVNTKRRAYKAWAFSEAFIDPTCNFREGEGVMKVTLPDGRRAIYNGLEGWYFHVALALPVQITASQRERLVFNPGLFDGPVSLQRWGQVLGAPEYGLEIRPFGQAPDGFCGDYLPDQRDTRAKLKSSTDNPIKVLERIRSKNPLQPRSVFPSEYRKLAF